MPAERYLIVNADDFGLSEGVNRGIIEAHERGIVTSASLMVRGAAVEEAARYARLHPALSLGLHLDLCEWIYKDGAWEPLYEVVPFEDGVAVAAEVSSQIESFRQIAGLEPTHLDSHQHVHRSEPLRSMMIEAANRLGVPLRHHSPLITYSGSFYGQTAKGEPYPEGISLDWLLDIIRALPAGVTELGCHPGFSNNLESTYRLEREEEVRVLCDAHVREVIRAEGIELCSFDGLKGNPA